MIRNSGGGLPNGNTGRILTPGKQPIIGQHNQIEIGPIDEDLHELMSGGQVGMVVALQTLREVRRLREEMKESPKAGGADGESPEA